MSRRPPSEQTARIEKLFAEVVATIYASTDCELDALIVRMETEGPRMLFPLDK